MCLAFSDRICRLDLHLGKLFFLAELRFLLVAEGVASVVLGVENFHGPSVQRLLGQQASTVQ